MGFLSRIMAKAHDWNTRRKMERLFRREEDPYGYFSHPHELGKQALAETMLAGRRYARALEIGCAEGAFTRRLARLCGEVLAVDISPTALSRAREWLKDVGNVRFLQANARELDFSPDWDLIVVSEFLYYIEKKPLPAGELDRFLSRLAGLVAPGGRVLVLHSFAGPAECAVRSGYVERLLAAGGLRPEREQVGGDDLHKCRYLASLLIRSETPAPAGDKEETKMPRLKRLMTVAFTATAVALSAHDMSPKQEAQLKRVFPEAAEFSEKHVNLTEEQVAQASAKLGDDLVVEEREVRLLAAHNEEAKLLGHAVYFSIKDKDGDPVKGLVGLRTDGMVKKVVLFSHDKADPLTQEAFLGQFTGKKTDPVQWGNAVKPARGHEAASKVVAQAIHRSAILAEEAVLLTGDPHREEVQVKNKANKASSHDTHTPAYQCPMKDTPAQTKPGRCSKCGMMLEKLDTDKVGHKH